jgi:hypothetical protein
MRQNYQRIEVDGKLYADGIDRGPEYNIIFPGPPRGKTIIDLGCHMGYYILRASNEGAKYCLGLELKKDWATVGRWVAEEKDLKVVILTDNVFSYSFDRKFDILLCLNFLHYVLSIRKMTSLLYSFDQCATEEMVFVVWPPGDDSLDYKLGSVHGGKIPRMFISPSYFEKMWPNYRITTTQSIISPERVIVKVRKD